MTARPSSPTAATSPTTPSPTKLTSPSRSSPLKSPTKQPLKLPSSPLASTGNASRPSAEDLIDLERELHRLIARKSAAEANLASLEGRLYDLETEYLTETAQFGNLVVGLEGYLGLPPPITANATTIATTTTTSTSATNRRSAFASGVANIAALTGGGFPLSQRLISGTSTTFPASLAALGRREEAIACGYDPETINNTSNALKKKVSTTSSSSNNNNNSTKVVKQTSPTKKSSTSSHKKITENWTPPPMKARKK